MSCFNLTGSSYQPAVTVLSDTYGQPDLIKAAHIRSLCELVHPKYDINDLKTFSAQFECTLESMRSLGVTVSDICAVILHNKLPLKLSEIIKRELKENWLNVDTYIQAMKNEVCTLESRKDNINTHKITSDSATATAAFTVNTNKKRSARDTKEVKKGGCLLCNNPSHFWGKCTKYKTGANKVNRAKQTNLCTGCLSSEHGGSGQGCTNPKIRPCMYCGQKKLQLSVPKSPL